MGLWRSQVAKLAVATSVGWLAGWAEAGICAVQLDLARQKESPAFVTNYMSRVRTAGYNTVVLYLEDRVKTPSYPYPADADSYSLEEMARIVRYGVSIGLDVVPVISPLGHTERFLPPAGVRADVHQGRLRRISRGGR